MSWFIIQCNGLIFTELNTNKGWWDVSDYLHIVNVVKLKGNTTDGCGITINCETILTSVSMCTKYPYWKLTTGFMHEKTFAIIMKLYILVHDKLLLKVLLSKWTRYIHIYCCQVNYSYRRTQVHVLCIHVGQSVAV